MRTKNKSAVFILQINEGFLKAIKCSGDKNRREFVGLQLEALPADLDERGLVFKLKQLLSRLEYRDEPVIVSLPRNQATCRYLKIPSTNDKEIKKIVNLQASRYLPYSADELITAYQVVSIERSGNSFVNLVIAHKDAIERYIRISNELRAKKIAIVLSSFGLCNLLMLEPGTVMILDLDFNQAELAIASGKKLLFSRSFKLDRMQPDWKNQLVDEINRTQEAYIKEVSGLRPARCIITGAANIIEESFEFLKQNTSLPIEVLALRNKAVFTGSASSGVLNSSNSFDSLIGLGLEELPESLNLLPENMKENIRKFTRRYEYIRAAALIFGIIVVWFFATLKDLDNKAKYLTQLRSELNEIAKEARPLEEMEKRFKILESQTTQKPTSLDILYELHQIAPGDISLSNLIYEDNNRLVLRGQSMVLNSVFNFAAKLKKSQVFNNFSVDVRYATPKKTQTGEIVDFEIVCAKK